MLNQPKTRPCRFPKLIGHNYTDAEFHKPVRILRTILQWNGALITATWFTN